MSRVKKITTAISFLTLLVLLFLLAPSLIYRRGDTFGPSSRQRQIIWLSKRIVAEIAAAAVSVWDPYRERMISASIGPAENDRESVDSPLFSSRDKLQSFFNEDSVFQSGIVRYFTNDTLPQCIFPFYYQTYAEPMLDSLDRLYGLSSLAVGEDNDYALFKKMTRWLYNHFKDQQTRQSQIPIVDYNFNALDILDRVGKGERFWCSEYSTALVQCLAAMGYTARYVMLGSGGEGHVLCEAWCETYGKWIMLDPYWSRIVTVDNVPLGVYEIHLLLFSPPNLARAEIVQLEKLRRDGPEPDFYFSLFRNFAVRMRNDWFTNKYPHWYPLSNSVMNAVEWQDSLTVDNIYYKYETTRLEDLYWPLNRVRMSIHPGSGETLKVYLNTFTPNFSHFLIEHDSTGIENIKTNNFTWKIDPGSNRLKVSSVNHWGIKGREVKLEIEREGFAR